VTLGDLYESFVNAKVAGGHSDLRPKLSAQPVACCSAKSRKRTPKWKRCARPLQRV